MNAFFHWFEYPFQSHIGSNICSSQVPRAKSQVPSVKWPSPLIRSLTLYQRLMTVPPQGTNCPFYNIERTIRVAHKMKPEHAPAPHRLKYEVQHNTNVSRTFHKKERTKCRTAQEAGTRAAPPSRCGCGWCSGTITAGPSGSAGRLVLVFRTGHLAPAS